MAHIRRVGREINEFDLWYWFERSSSPYMDIHEAKKPELAEEIEVILEDENKKSKEPLRRLLCLRTLVTGRGESH